jgi:NAD dependent epimerase/dehydratase family enzyme
VCTPTATTTRHYELFHIPTDPNGEINLAAARPEVLAPMQTALERWMNQQTESSIPEIFPAGEP